MKLNKKIIQLLTIMSLFSVTHINSYANTSDITIDSTFTYEDGLWQPGRVESKSFYINNNKESDIKIDRLYMSLKSSKSWKTGEELDTGSKQFKELAKNSIVTLTHDGKVLFKDKLKDLLLVDGIVLSNELNIKANDKELLNMTIDMDLEMNNDAQALDNVFNIGVAYKMDEETTPPIIPGEPSNPDVDNPTKPDKPSNSETDNQTKPDKPINPDTDVDGSQSDKLPQTGGIINGASLVVLGTVAIGTGFVLNKKSSKEKGGKHHE
ncbi:LPXTG cell wall anchor domain-containing protein [Paraclostridium sordellii]|uniref:LPXTG cell wall anchor domain-containing protein n=1 Tax=Paraclostridium sordellii TaxID=1505 RepID=UPI0005E9DC4D|nr:LPXTG cell wall anchor domain-containing protein [Paeniclostridium sordellii]MDU2688844.1 LPXTG cell wall anchor domain-containing protein [Paeniclostridium sordellii]MVO71277.1 LPXTG cell wall anchor domain-containing protein [Paeniclostridium sordellii]CEO31869.1 anchor protein [[Clostridium] sordellii] [Paeniclostridium sordellii]CEP49862.1 anchor protein [[Clostridium] sordellii] [Paeniclostridium sordellii]